MFRCICANGINHRYTNNNLPEYRLTKQRDYNEVRPRPTDILTLTTGSAVDCTTVLVAHARPDNFMLTFCIDRGRGVVGGCPSLAG